MQLLKWHIADLGVARTVDVLEVAFRRSSNQSPSPLLVEQHCVAVLVVMSFERVGWLDGRTKLPPENLTYLLLKLEATRHPLTSDKAY